MNLRQRLDPRLHLTAAIGWTVFAIILLAALAGANLASREAERRIRADIERLLTQFATQIHLALDMNLATRRSILQTTAAQIVASYDRGTEALRHPIEAVQAQFPEFVWLGVADERGQVVAATGGILHGADVSTQSWFQEGQQHPFLGDTRHYPLLEQMPPMALSNRSPGFVAAVPILQPSGQRIGVLGARLSWDWIARQQDRLLHELETEQPLDLLLITADHFVVMGPSNWLGRTLTTDSDLSDRGSHMVGRHSARDPSKAGLDWSVVLRQEANTALLRAKTIHHMIFLLV
ncbi:MAG: cache domain-containing protein, partial [Phycisphaerales bacterium]|nr:cache domain-containing protein [Phycisphaerales bacterium]